mmetsp:Transcript_33491/g.38314  ORF Transcript_33491/g.38314 Transcript_33491/m.38314 type:complete len:799 (-) Transcript_33491:30-2426(-)
MISRGRQILQSLTESNYYWYRRSGRTICSRSFGNKNPLNHLRSPLSSHSSCEPYLSSHLQRSHYVSFLSTVAQKEEGRKMTSQAGNKRGKIDNANSDRDQFVPSSRFEDLNLHPQTLKALRRQGIHRLTEIQEKTYDFILNGHNLVARSRTGTGKTLAFLVPSLERQLLREQQYNADKISTSTEKINNFGIPILILAPTRELAAQIHKEAEKLLSVFDNHRDLSSKLSAQVIYGGLSKDEDVRQFQSLLPTILVATPGRLKDHLASTTLKLPHRKDYHNFNEFGNDKNNVDNGNVIPFRNALQNGNLKTLVLDETDRLLELGFRRDVQDILSCLNDTSTGSSSLSIPQSASAVTPLCRQTLLFSATLAHGVLDVVDIAMSTSSSNKKRNSGKRNNDADTNYQMVDCILDDDPTTHTNMNTEQSYIVLPSQKFWTGSIEVLLNLMTTYRNDCHKSRSTKKKKNKIIVFFEMTRLVQLYSKFLSLRLGYTTGVWELHGKMHQQERTVVARRFRNASQGILLTSDVSARGVDYPDVSHVIQVGAPKNRETYIHRLGRTGRAGKLGKGLLILPELEREFVEEELEGLELFIDNLLQQSLLSNRTSSGDLEIRKNLKNELGLLRQDMINGQDVAGMEESLRLAYHSMISYYFQTRRRGGLEQSSERLVSVINQLIQDFGLSDLPAIDSRRAKRMGIEDLPGLNIRKDWGDHSWRSNDDFQRKEYGDFDEWFGVARGPRIKEKNLVLNQKDEYEQSENDNSNNKEHRSSVDLKRFGREIKTKSKRKKLNLDNFQRWEAPRDLKK